ncbi:MAG TPA: deoxynucleoside kinase [Bacteroidia bacterium]|nr:deoxynucleoside kinase [Bacteroidia bacterium]HNT79923.1 deoxynucleoside kinase [Bacteroidia bacterium]
MNIKDKYPFLSASNFIAIEGNIGAGKSSLSTKLSLDFDKELLLEDFASKTFLSEFYSNPERFAFPLELSFIADRYMQLKDIDIQNKKYVADYHFLKNIVFASVNLQNEELGMYHQLYLQMDSLLPKPELVVFLNCGIEKLQSQIKLRARAMENNIESNYLLSINDSYKKNINDQSDIHSLFINTDTLDFINNDDDYNFIIHKMNDFLGKKK